MYKNHFETNFHNCSQSFRWLKFICLFVCLNRGVNNCFLHKTSMYRYFKNNRVSLSFPMPRESYIDNISFSFSESSKMLRVSTVRQNFLHQIEWPIVKVFLPFRNILQPLVSFCSSVSETAIDTRMWADKKLCRFDN